jgi:hypothetical protein
VIDFIGFTGLALFVVGNLAMVAAIFFIDDWRVMDRLVPLSMAGMVIGLILMGAAAITSSVQESGRLMDQCLADGKKEYECRAIVRHATGADQPIQPVIVVR